MEELQKRVKELEDFRNVVQPSINNTILDKIVNIRNQMEKHDKDISLLNSAIQDVDTYAKELEKKVQKMETKLEATMKSLTKKNKKIEALDNKINALAEKKSSSRLRFLSKGKK